MTDDLNKLADELAEAAERAREVNAEQGTDLVRLQQDPVKVKADMERIRQEAAKQAEVVKQRANALKAQAEEMIAAAKAELQPLVEMQKQLEEGIWTVNLYLGRDERIIPIRAEGKVAPADTPVCVRQLVLAMDQECAARAEDGGIDHVSLDEFDEWLLADPAHVQQVIPEPKSIVALVPRFTDKDYGDPWSNASRNRENKRTYFLIRNGERLHRTTTEFSVGKRLVPGPDEFNRYFRTAEDEHPMKPGSRRWIEAEEKAEERQRHYMRVALILEGLVHRTPLFHPLPEWGISFIDSSAHRDGRVRFILDGDEGKLESGKEKFRDWQKRLNAQLRPGLRIMGYFGYGSGFERHDYEKRYGNDRIYPSNASKPGSGPHLLEKNSRGKLIFRYKRAKTDVVYDSYWRSHEPKNRASCEVQQGDRWIIPFDLAEVEDMERFLITRGDRPEYEEMFPVLKRAIKLKREEAEAESPFHEMLAGVLVRDAGGTAEQAETAVPELTRWWKLKNRYHRPLIGTEDEQAKAVREITAEYRKRILERPADDPELIRKLAGTPGFVHLSRRNDGIYVLYQRERHDHNVFLRVTEVTKTGKRREPQRWQVWRPAMDRHRVLETTDAWTNWNRTATRDAYLTDDEIEQAVREVRAKKKGAVAVICGYDPVKQEWPHEGARNQIWLWVATVDDEDHEEERGAPAVQPIRYEIWRDADGTLRLRDDTYRDSYATVHWSREPDRFRDGENAKPGLPWERKGWGLARGYGRKARWQNDALIAKLDAAMEVWQKADDERRERRERAWPAKRSLRDGWIAAEDKKRFDAFMDEYGDASLWDGHRKTLKDIDVPHGVLDAAQDLIDRAYEKNIDPDGLTVKELADKFGADAEFSEQILSLRISTTEPEHECPHCAEIMHGRKCEHCGGTYYESFTVSL